MSKKNIFKLGVISLFVVFIIYAAVFFKPIAAENISISFDVELSSPENDIVQIFYLEKNEDSFSEVNANAYLVKANEKENVRFQLGDIETIRIDFGGATGICRIDNMQFSMGLFNIDWEENDWSVAKSINGIDALAYENHKMEINSNSTDPYIVWDVENFGLEERFEQSIYLSNLIIRLILTAILVLMLYVIIKKFEFFVEFPTEIWRSRVTLMQLAKNDFKSRFAGSYLGIVWAFVQPIVTVLVYWFVFEKGLKAGAMTNVPFVLWLIAGIIPWFFFSDGLSAGTGALIEYQYLVKKVVFQISILPLVKIISNLFVHMVFVAFAIILFVGYGYYPDLYYLQIIYYSFCVFVLALGLSYITSALIGFFRDLSQIIVIFLQVGIWMAPIMWNMETMDLSEGLKLVLKANPMYYIVSGYRDAFINKAWFWENMGLTIYFWIFTLVIVGIGMFTFKKLRVHFADVL